MQKQVVLVIAQEKFRDEEYFEPKKILEDNNIKVITASLKKGACTGKLGGSATADISIDDLNPEDIDGLFFIGGPGASVFFQNKKAHELLIKMSQSDKLIGAICAGPGTLAYAGLLKGKKATSFVGVSSDLLIQGALWTGSDVEIDGRIITADGPYSAVKFGQAIVQELKKV